MSQKDYVSRGRANQPKKKRQPPKKAKPNRPQGKFKQENHSQNPSIGLWIKLGIVVVLLIGFAIGLWSIKDNAPEPDNTVLPESIATTGDDGLPELPEEEWEYIKSLPGYEVEVDLSEQATSGKRYLMQCASFRTRAQAEEMKAKIAFQGFEALIRRSAGDKGDWFRVILGPYDTKRDAERERHSLRRANITTCKIWFWNL